MRRINHNANKKKANNLAYDRVHLFLTRVIDKLPKIVFEQIQETIKMNGALQSNWFLLYENHGKPH